MAESDFSWKRMLSFYGAGILVFLAFAMIAGGISLIQDGNAFNGVTCIIGAIVSALVAFTIYKSQQKRSKDK